MTHSDPSVEMIRALEQGDCSLRTNTALNPAPPPSVLTWLANSEDLEVRQAVAKNVSTPVAVLERLGDSSVERTVRFLIALNPRTPLTVLERMAEDSFLVRALIRNPDCPTSILTKAAAGVLRFDFAEITIIIKHPNAEPGLVEMFSRVQNSNADPSELHQLALEKLDGVRYLVAKHPSTDVATLELLASDAVDNIRSGVAENPKTPGHVLERLAARGNGLSVRITIAENPNTPPSALESLVDDSNCRLALAKNPNTSLPARMRLMVDDNKEVRAAIGTSLAILRSIERLASHCNADVREAVAKYAQTPGEILSRLASDKSYSVNCAVARNPNTPSGVLSLLAKEAEPPRRPGDRANRDAGANLPLREALCSNSNTSAETLDALYKAPSWRVRWGWVYDDDRNVRLKISNHSRTNSKTLEKLAHDICPLVRLVVAEHANTPATALELLSRIKDGRINLALAKHPQTPPHILERLSRSGDDQVRWAVARNLRTSVAVLEHLANDCQSHVRTAVENNPNTPPGLKKVMRG